MGFQNTVKPKRSLGQNFFNNKSLLINLIDTLFQSNPSHITEIGPGQGAFTEEIYKRIKNITLIEKDQQLSELLKIKYPDIEIKNIDFLDYELNNPNTTYFGSLPYNVSKPIIKKIISSTTFTKPAFFIIQKEVAQKYQNLERNQLGLIRELYADCKILKHTKPESFTPRPNVTSTFIKFSPHDKYKNIDYQKFETLIFQSFNQPRKTLKNNLRNTSYKLLENEENQRPDQLNIEQYISILLRS